MQFNMSRMAAAIAAVLAVVALVSGGQATAATKVNAVDRAFVREMVPHHEMAVEMARMAEMQGQHAEI
jgi:uncharacterized protein (DUF305 family)